VSWKPEVIADSSGKWAGNGLCFATRPEAHAYVIGLMLRWTAVRDTREVEVEHPVTHRWDPERGVVEVEQGEPPVLIEIEVDTTPEPPEAA
jgi:hypothetical protein